MRIFKGTNLNFKVYGWDNFYNPFNSETIIEFYLKDHAYITLKIYFT